MIYIVAAIVLAVSLILAGFCLYRRKRDRDRRTVEAQKKSQAAFLELERRRFKSFPQSCTKEIQQIVKERYPDSNRHERRVIVARYRKMVKNT